MNKQHKLILILGFLVLAYFAKPYLFPNDKDVIQQRSVAMAKIMGRESGENLLVLAQKTAQVLEYFKTPVDLKFTDANEVSRKKTLTDPSQVKDRVATVKMSYDWVEVVFTDINVTLEGPRARSENTVKLFFSDKGERVYDLYAVTLGWEKIDGDWLIRSVEAEAIEP